jgi:integrase
MTSIYARYKTLWCKVKKAGKWVSKKTPYRVGDELKAKRYAEAAQRRIDELERAGGTAPDTVKSYAARWIAQRKAADLDWINDGGRLRNQILPAIGNMLLSEVRAPKIAELMRGLRFPEGESKRLSQRTIYNIYSVVSAMFRDAAIEGKIEQTPCILTKHQLGPLVDSDPEWRAGAVFTRDEAEQMISDPRIPQDRRVVYAFGLLAGLRPGESAAARWRHYDPLATPLGKLTIAVAFNSRKNKVKGTKTNAVRYVPVHSTLAAILAEWRLSGWPAMCGRAPGPDDLIVPLPPAAAAKRRSRTGDAYRAHDYTRKRWRDSDCPMLGWRYREPYAIKSTFITLALGDGARGEIIRDRVTHTKPGRTAFDGYDRGLHWKETCTEVAKLQIKRRPPAIEVGDRRPPVEEGGELGTGFGTDGEIDSNIDAIAVEAAGVEPASEDVSGLASTRVGTPLVVSRSPAAAGRRARQVSEVSASVC